MDARTYLENLYLDFVNNYMTMGVFAEHNGITCEQAEKLVMLAREVYNSQHPDK